MIELIQPRYNAVVIHLIDVEDKIIRHISIECKDMELLPKLEEMARKYHELSYWSKFDSVDCPTCKGTTGIKHPQQAQRIRTLSEALETIATPHNITDYKFLVKKYEEIAKKALGETV